MNPTIKNILVVIAGLFIGSVVNMLIIIGGTSILGLPEGIESNSVESIKNGIHLFEPKHFLTPFLAHVIGTLTGAFIATKYGVSKKMVLAMIVGGLFLLGGISNSFSIPAPIWFNLLDLVVAYIPMTYLGYKLGTKEN
ncbi:MULTISPECIES: hypothetical protein [Flavobacterium]|uniref:Uncharacterized protein n=1 Tax=Flavobacterium hankyongi TaxID=1176532 RepID=A0ABP8ZIB7_9FLAO|nr:hypothetical protein [Flavobacterium sp. N1846]